MEIVFPPSSREIASSERDKPAVTDAGSRGSSADERAPDERRRSMIECVTPQACYPPAFCPHRAGQPSVTPNRSRRSGQHPCEQLRGLSWLGADRRQLGWTQRHPRQARDVPALTSKGRKSGQNGSNECDLHERRGL